jgi:glucokinase
MSPSAKSLAGGIDLGGTKIQSAVIGPGGKVVGEERRPTPTKGGPEDIERELAESMRAAAQQAGVEMNALAGVGVGSPGDVDEKTGEVSGARNLPGWEGSYPLAQRLSESLGTKVKVGNDVNVAVNAEFELGAARPYDSIIGVWWGTGVGGGIILEGKPWLGRGAAAEIGHMVIKRGGARCSCGRRGCMEAYAGRMAMERKAREMVKDGAKTKLFKIMEERGRDRLSSGVWDRALKQGDDLATHLMDRAVKGLAAGIASAINLLDPEAVILGGGMGSRFGDKYAHRVQARMLRHLFTDDNPPPMHVAELGDYGGAIGASLLIAPRKPSGSR